MHKKNMAPGMSTLLTCHQSHYIGPLHSSPAMETGALYDYVSTMPHEGWRNVLPTFISMYKNGTSDVAQESITAYYSKYT